MLLFYFTIPKLLVNFISGNRASVEQHFTLWSRDLIFRPRKEGGLEVRDPFVDICRLAARRVGLLVLDRGGVRKWLAEKAADLPVGFRSFWAHEDLLKTWEGRSVRWKQTCELFMKSKVAREEPRSRWDIAQEPLVFNRRILPNGKKPLGRQKLAEGLELFQLGDFVGTSNDGTCFLKDEKELEKVFGTLTKARRALKVFHGIPDLWKQKLLAPITGAEFLEVTEFVKKKGTVGVWKVDAVVQEGLAYRACDCFGEPLVGSAETSAILRLERVEPVMISAGKVIGVGGLPEVRLRCSELYDSSLEYLQEQDSFSRYSGYIARAAGPGGDEWAEYDARAMAEYFRARPLLVARRLAQIGAVVGGWAGKRWADAKLGRAEETFQERAGELRQALVLLGPAFVKIAQAVSSRPDVIPPEYVDELSLLQDRIAPFPTRTALDLIEAELGVPVDLLFDQISPSPVAAASLGQVYEARLRAGGQRVAVKVQRPGVQAAIVLDIFILRVVAGWLRQYRKLNTDLQAVVDEWATSLFREMDYEQEAQNGIKFAELFGRIERVVVPRMYPELTTRRVLIMEWIDGQRLADSKDVSLVEVGVYCSLSQLLDYGFYHADPHPGNFLLTRDQRLAYLDFGMMGSMDRDVREAFIRAAVHLVNREFDLLAGDFVTLGLLPPGQEMSEVSFALTAIFKDAVSSGVRNISFGSLATQLGQTMYNFKFRLPAYFSLVVRSLSVLEGIALKRDPNYKVIASSYPWIAKKVLTDPSPQLRSTVTNLLFKEGQFRVSRLESLLKEIIYGWSLQSSKPMYGPDSAAKSQSTDDTSKEGRTKTLKRILKFGLSEEGRFIRELLLDEVAKVLLLFTPLSCPTLCSAHLRTLSTIHCRFCKELFDHTSAWQCPPHPFFLFSSHFSLPLPSGSPVALPFPTFSHPQLSRSTCPNYSTPLLSPPSTPSTTLPRSHFPHPPHPSPHQGLDALNRVTLEDSSAALLSRLPPALRPAFPGALQLATEEDKEHLENLRRLATIVADLDPSGGQGGGGSEGVGGGGESGGWGGIQAAVDQATAIIQRLPSREVFTEVRHVGHVRRVGHVGHVGGEPTATHCHLSLPSRQPPTARHSSRCTFLMSPLHSAHHVARHPSPHSPIPSSWILSHVTSSHDPLRLSSLSGVCLSPHRAVSPRLSSPALLFAPCCGMKLPLPAQQTALLLPVELAGSVFEAPKKHTLLPYPTIPFPPLYGGAVACSCHCQRSRRRCCCQWSWQGGWHRAL
ncbi:unnamed protein product [Closterium sp. NIES-53]